MITPARWRRIYRKGRLRLGLAAAILRGYEDTVSRSTCKVSFSQAGEDLIAWGMLSELGINRPSYLDIGAHDPDRLSNTALFYRLGCRGMNIEPDVELFAAFLHRRRGDINLNIGIAVTPGTMTFYQMADRTLSTFNAAEAFRVAAECRIPIAARIPVPVRPITDVLEEHHFRPDFLSIDVEGGDLEVLQSFDFIRHRPKVICAETITFSTTGGGVKQQPILEFLHKQGYRAHADTHINTLFFDARLIPV